MSFSSRPLKQDFDRSGVEASDQNKVVPPSPEETTLEEPSNRSTFYVTLDHLPSEEEDNDTTPTRSNLLSLGKSRSRANVALDADRISLSPMKEKSQTLPQTLNDSRGGYGINSSAARLMLSPGAISTASSSSAVASTPPQVICLTAKSPRKSLSFIRRSHSTKVSRSSSLLRSFTSTINPMNRSEASNIDEENPVVALNAELLERLYKTPVAEDFDEALRRVFFKEFLHAPNTTAPATSDGRRRNDESNTQEDDAIHSDTSYEKACRRGSVPSTPILGSDNGHEPAAISRFTNFFSKRSFRSNPLKRTKSVTKLERTRKGPGLRGSRSHESLLSGQAIMSTIDLSCTEAVGVAAVHQSVLGRRHCFQVRGGPRGERFYSCGSRQERDLWIYSLRKSIDPNAEHHRHTDNSLKLWIYEAKGLPPKKKYFCEIHLDQTLYGRTSAKLRTDLLFWGEHFDFPDIPNISTIKVLVYRESEKKKKREKHVLVGAVTIPTHQVRTAFSENWHAIVSEKHNSISRSSAKEVVPTLRIKCRFQQIDVLPIAVYDEFLQYLKLHYKKICEMLEPVIGVKAKEDIGQAMVLIMHSQGMASAFLADVVALDLLRVGDQRLTFRGNSLATKSMEAFLKLTGEQYLQDTLAAPISEIIASDRDCEVDPLKATGSLAEHQQSLRQAVHVAWMSIAESARHFPPQLRECFATFRERLQALGRQDMADNLISASIFLRFLCPAILSPSLFNITNELPSDRATRNLTLVAKTLQTLANFTRFQAKEGYMEYLNDWIEEEAPNMKDFLHTISMPNSADDVQENSVLSWPGYIDQGKQLSIIHALLVENLAKLPTNKGADVHELLQILKRLSRAKEHVGDFSPVLTEAEMGKRNHSTGSTNKENELMTSTQMFVADSKLSAGVIRGVLTPNALEKNIFRYNDPTCVTLVQNVGGGGGQLAPNVSNSDSATTRLQHGHSTTSLSSAANFFCTSSPVKGHHYPKAGSSEVISAGGAIKFPKTLSASGSLHETKHISHHVYDGLLNTGLPDNRANTLPKNSILVGGGGGEHAHKFKANQTMGDNMIQIGMDQGNAFVRRSPTPLAKVTNNQAMRSCSSAVSLQRDRFYGGSQQSLLSDRGGVNRSLNNASIGVPQNDHNQNNYQGSGSGTFKMPMHLEDLDDLLKYADEHGGDPIPTKKDRMNADIENGNVVVVGTGRVKPKDLLTAKGSNNSIGQLSNMCSSGYQSIATQSQSSSPVEPMGDYSNGGGRQVSSLNTRRNHPRNGPLKYQFGGTTATANAVSNLNYRTQKSSQLTPSSSEERLGHDHHSFRSRHRERNAGGSNPRSGGFTIGEIRGESELNAVTSSLNNSRSIEHSGSSRRPVYSRTPRTNPMLFYNGSATTTAAATSTKEDAAETEEPLSYSAAMGSRALDSAQFQRRQSVESSPRTVSGSSSDTEGGTSEGQLRRRGNGARSVEQYEKEIKRLQTSMDCMRRRLEGFELRDSNSDLSNHHSDTKMRSIISRLIAMEEELRREQLKMSLALSHKQKVIEAQGQQIAALDAANNRLLSALSNLRQRYESQNQPDGVSTSSSEVPPQSGSGGGHAPTMC